VTPCTIADASGELVSFDGEFLVARVSKAFAPGTPFHGSVALEGGPLAIEGRANGSKRTSEGAYELRARIVNLRREDRLRLEAASRGA
jgi:hypothetical protein